MYDIITIGGATRDITFLTDKGKVIETPENLTEQALLCFEHGAKIYRACRRRGLTIRKTIFCLFDSFCI